MAGDIERRIKVPRLYPAQARIVSEAKRFNVLCAGRRFGKSSMGIERAADPMLAGLPVAWFAPTYKTLDEFWRLISRVYAPITTSRSEQQHRLEVIGGGSLEMWSLENPDSARGRHYARVILDECAVVRNLLEAWNYVIRSTLIDLEGDAWFLSTPKGRNDFAKLWALADTDDEWAHWQLPTSENPYLPASELEGLRLTMPLRAYEQEIEARFIDEVTGALFKQADIDAARVTSAPELARIAIGVDPAGSTSRDSDETGIVAFGIDRCSPPQGYVLADSSGTYSPEIWARKAIGLYELLGADFIVAEANFGGDMVKHTLRTVDSSVPVRVVHASRGKAIRAEPVAAVYEQGRVHHVGRLDELELQLTTWSPMEDAYSPDRLDALVHAFAKTMGAGSVWSPEDIARIGQRWAGEVPLPTLPAPIEAEPDDRRAAYEAEVADRQREALAKAMRR